MKIMIVDDHIDMRRMLRSIVSDGKNEIIECSDGEEAVKQYFQFHPDYVLMDIQLGTMDGFVATEKIYKKEPSANIIFVTSHDTPVFRLIAKKLRARGFVCKDNLSEINHIINSSLNSGGAFT